MNLMWDWLFDSANWQGDEGIPQRILEHLQYCAIAVVLAALIAVPLGLLVGHTGRGRFLAVNSTGALRALPSLGLLYAAYMWLGDDLAGERAFLYPTEIVLVALAAPPLLAGTYAGVEQVDPAARDAARGMGMTGRELLTKVEIPCALPLMLSGLRSAVLQVIATATLAATLGLGGLVRYLLDGLAVRDYGQMAGGALIVAVLALTLDLLLAVAQKVLVSPGLTGKTALRPTLEADTQALFTSERPH
jgi:osmoprotectant transport system permease protein